MDVREYMEPICQVDKRYHKMFLKFILKNNVYVPFNDGIGLRETYGWYYMLQPYDFQIYHILDMSFSWGVVFNDGISWGILNERWKFKVKHEELKRSKYNMYGIGKSQI